MWEVKSVQPDLLSKCKQFLLTIFALINRRHLESEKSESEMLEDEKLEDEKLESEK